MAKKTSDYPAKKKRLIQDLTEARFSPAYLICGEEAYLRRQDAKLLLDKLGAKEGDMNFTRFSGKETTAEAVMETAMTMPFFAESRVILVEESGWFAAKKRQSGQESESGQESGIGEKGEAPASSGSEDGKKMAAYLKTPAETTRIVFLESDVNRTTSLYKALDSHGFILTCDSPADADLRRWVAKKFAGEGMRVEERAVERLLALTAGGVSNEPRTDMNLLAMQMEKVICYCMGREEIRLADVEAVCSDSLMDNVYKMVELMAKRDGRGAMTLYQDMLTQKIAPQRILALMVNQFDNILRVLELHLARRSPEEIKDKLSLHPFVVKLCTGWSRNFTQERLQEILEICAASDAAIKSGRMGDRIAVETAIIRCTI